MKEKNYTNSMFELKKRLDEEVVKRDKATEISQDRLDPIIVAHRYKDETISLICALFAYGNVRQIVKFLDSLDFSLLDADDHVIQKELKNHYYRFQNSQDIVYLFIALKRLRDISSIEDLFVRGYEKNKNALDGINEVLKTIYGLCKYSSRGYSFLLGKVTTKTKGAGALKRWMMYLRWMVRDDNIDMGLWSKVDKSDLIMPLDTHTFNVSKRLGLLKRKTYDLQSAIELTCKLKEFDENDPLKYDFALYRIGQEKIL